MGNQGDPSANKGDYTILWIIVCFFVIGGILWYFFSEQFIQAFLHFRRYEAMLVLFVTDRAQELVDDLNKVRPAEVTLQYAWDVSEQVSVYLRYVSASILGIFFVITFKNHSLLRFNKIYNMDSLTQQEMKNWQQISPMAHMDLVSIDINKGEWAVSENPLQFCRANKLLKVERVPDPKKIWRDEGMIRATVLKEKAEQVFSRQLGALWAGPQKLPPHAKALFAIFCARIEHDGDAGRLYLDQLAASAAKGKIDYSLTDEYIKKYGQAKAVKLCEERHGFVMSVMATMMELSRTDGVLATADFLWLKPVDRNLWYMLNSVGRQVAFAEVGGAWAHWLAEKELGRSLSVPMVDEAIVGLETAIENVIYEAEDGEEIPWANETSAA